MREAIKVPCVLLVVAVLIAACSASIEDSCRIGSYGVIRRLPWLHVEGQWIVNEDGSRVALRGGGGSYSAYGRWDDLERFFQEVKAIGGNCYRLAFNPPRRQGDAWQVKMTGYNPADMDRALDLCEQYGLYAILDCHHWQGSGDPNEWHLLPNYKDHWIQTWVEIAERYKDHSVVAGYELCNEAWSYANMALECIDAIRQVDSNHIIFLIETANTVWSIHQAEIGGTPRTWRLDQVSPNCVYMTHHWWGYPVLSKPYSPTDYEMGYCAASIYVSGLKELRDFYNAPVLAGEFGMYDYDMDNADAEHVREIIRLCENQGISWWYWMMEKLVRDNGKHLPDLVSIPFESPVYDPDIPRTFNPKTFNMLDRIVAQGRQGWDYNWWDYTYYAIPGSDAWITVQGPCTVKVREWSGSIWWGTLENEYLVSIPDGENQTIQFSLRKEVFAY